MSSGNRTFDQGFAGGVEAERARIVEALATIHRPFGDLCHGCHAPLNADGDCPTVAALLGDA